MDTQRWALERIALTPNLSPGEATNLAAWALDLSLPDATRQRITRMYERDDGEDVADVDVYVDGEPVDDIRKLLIVKDDGVDEWTFDVDPDHTPYTDEPIKYDPPVGSEDNPCPCRDLNCGKRWHTVAGADGPSDPPELEHLYAKSRCVCGDPDCPIYAAHCR